MGNQIKDYYTILGVSPVATTIDIKRSYRKLAFKYHPDTNPGNNFASSMFREIQEAYHTLSDAVRRRKYDEERWLSGMSSRAKDQHVITPQWILAECRKLNLHIATVDTYRMDHGALHAYISLLLSDTHMAVLQREQDIQINNSIAHLLLSSSRHIRAPYMQSIAARIKQLALNDDSIVQQLDMQVKKSNNAAQTSKYAPLLVLIITLLLILFMYIWAS